VLTWTPVGEALRRLAEPDAASPPCLPAPLADQVLLFRCTAPGWGPFVAISRRQRTRQVAWLRDLPEAALAGLGARQRWVVDRYSGRAGGGEPRSRTELAAELGVTRERVGRWLRVAMGQIRANESAREGGGDGDTGRGGRGAGATRRGPDAAGCGR
jgi:hypothetical protein